MTKLDVFYDRPVDVLHVRLERSGLFEADDIERGLEFDFSVEDGKPCGATVIGFRRNLWTKNVRRLADLIAGHLSMPADDLAGEIERHVR